MILDDEVGIECTQFDTENLQTKEIETEYLWLPSILRAFRPEEIRELWVAMAREEGDMQSFLDAYFLRNPPCRGEECEVKRFLHWFASETGYKVTIKCFPNRSSECWNIRKYRYKKCANNRKDWRTRCQSQLMKSTS